MFKDMAAGTVLNQRQIENEEGKREVPPVVGLNGQDISKRIISWDVKGLWSPRKNFSIKEVLRKYKADVIKMQETKKQSINKKCLQTLWGVRGPNWVFTPADGSAGGMFFPWKYDFYELISMEYGIYSLSVKLSDHSLGVPWWFSCIYGPQLIEQKNNSGLNYMTLAIWLKLLSVSVETSTKCLYSEDRNGRRSSSVQTKKFHEWVTEFPLTYIPVKNTQYIWSNFRAYAACSKIDRYFSSIQWQEKFPETFRLRPTTSPIGSLPSIVGYRAFEGLFNPF